MLDQRSILSRPTAQAVLLGAVVACLAIGAHWLGVTQRFELQLQDRLVGLLSRDTPEPVVTMIWITETDIARYGHPISDTALAKALRLAAAAGPTAIGVDLYRSDDDSAVAAATADFEQVVMVEKLADAQSQGIAAPRFVQPRQIGFSDMALDSDGVLRRALLMMWDDDDDVHFSFALQLALLHLRQFGLGMSADPKRSEWVRLGNTTVAPLNATSLGYSSFDDGGYQTFIDSRQRPDLPSHTLGRLLAGDVPAADLTNRVVMFATASPSVKDSFRTPRGEYMFGGAIHGRIVDQLVRHALVDEPPMRGWPAWAEWLWIAGWCFLGIALGVRLFGPLIATSLFALPLLFLFGVALTALSRHLWLLTAVPFLGFAVGFGAAFASASWREAHERRDLMQLFGRFVSESLATEIWQSRHAFMQGRRPQPVRASISVLQSDLSGFTRAVEALAPDQVMGWIGRYMEQMVTIAEQHGGVVNDFVGDGLMVNFGVPIARESKEECVVDAINAVRCAVAMCAALDTLNTLWREEGLPEVRMRIGVASGESVLGAYGSDHRLKYTSIGGPVNVAARLENHDKAKFYDAKGHRVLAAESTAQLVGDNVPMTRYGTETLKGIAEPIDVFQVAIDQQTFPDEQKEHTNAQTTNRAGRIVPLRQS